jgi:hypothetical protein
MNPFENINTNIDEQSRIRGTIESEIRIFEDRILSVKREINILEGLIEINTFYSDKKTDNFLWIN